MKIARIEDYHRMQRELKKTKEVKQMLENASEGTADTQRRLMDDYS